MIESETTVQQAQYFNLNFFLCRLICLTHSTVHSEAVNFLCLS
jgi:hypothetical protein